MAGTRGRDSALWSADDRDIASAVAALVTCNPFLPERIELERRALGAQFSSAGTLWDDSEEPEPAPNVARLEQRAASLIEQAREHLQRGVRPPAAELVLYEDLVVYFLFTRWSARFYRLIEDDRAATARVAAWRPFAKEAERLLALPAGSLPWASELPHLFACCFQIRRAFHVIFRNILGGSTPAVRLRAAVWESIFTRDIRRYRRSLYRRMGDVATLIVGASGTGKELVARAIGLARYIPFDAAREAFVDDYAGAFYGLNPSALSPTLIEAELFGHRRGAFTGAVEERVGWLEVCPSLGTVFLDEIGDLDPAIQVKLLRVLQTRVFQRLGETRDRRFEGKLVAATNRDLAEEIDAGRFRRDLYYRLCADVVTTPTLAEQLADAPSGRRSLIRFIASRVAGADEAEHLADETERWIDSHLGAAYAWPGNVRELEQCVRNVLVRGEYRPLTPRTQAPGAALAAALGDGELTADELLRRYCTLVYAKTRSYQETARRLGLDRRTVRDKVDRALLTRL